MKGILEFDLPTDVVAFKRASKATDTALALWDIIQYLRGVDKYEQKDDIAQIRENVQTILDTHNVSMDEILE